MNPLFIIGAPRSGTTFFSHILNSNDLFTVWMEPNFIWKYNNGSIKDDRMDASNHSPKIEKYIKKKFSDYLLKSKKKYFAEKTPANCLRIPFINKLFPEAKYIHIYRNGYSCINSMNNQFYLGEDKNTFLSKSKSLRVKRIMEKLNKLKQINFFEIHNYFDIIFDSICMELGLKERYKYWGVRIPELQNKLDSLTIEEICAYQWKYCVKYARNDLQSIDSENVINLKYEDLVIHTDREIERISSFLGHSIIRPAKINSLKTYPENQACKAIIIDEMEELGYL